MKKYTIIIRVISTFHLYGAFSYLIANRLLNNHNKFIVIACFYSKNCPYRFDASDIDFLKQEDYKFFYDKDFNFSSIDISKKILILSPMHIPYRFIFAMRKAGVKSKINNISIDEGIGSYQSEFQSLKHLSKYGNKPLLYLILRFIAKQIPLYLYRICFIESEKRFFLFNKKNKTLKVNSSVVDAYKQFFSLQRNEKFRILSPNNNVVFCSDNVDDYLLDKRESNNIYNLIIQLIKEKYPLSNIYIKPHPYELNDFHIEQIGCKIIRETITTEDLINNNEITHVFSLCSTSLVTAALIFDKKCTSLVDYLPSSLISADKKKQIIDYKLRFAEIENLRFSL